MTELARVSGGPIVRCSCCSNWINGGWDRYGNPGGPFYCGRCGLAHNADFRAAQQVAESDKPLPAKDDGGPASNKSLRDWFAQRATLEDIAYQMRARSKTIPKARYDHADDMLAERSKEPDDG